MDNLGGQAKDEIRLRPRLERDTAEKILEIIKYRNSRSAATTILSTRSKTRRVAAKLYVGLNETS